LIYGGEGGIPPPIFILAHPTEKFMKKIILEDTGEEIEISQQIVNGITCEGFSVVFITEAGTFIQGNSKGIEVFGRKEFINKGMQIALNASKDLEALKEDLRIVHPIVIHSPIETEMSKLYPEYLTGGMVGLMFGAFSCPCYIIKKEVALSLKAFDIAEDTIAQIDLQKQVI